MANGVFNIAKGRGVYYCQQARDVANAALVVVLLQAAQADDTLNNYDTLAAALTGGNTEANFTNYARKTITGASVTVTVDDTSNLVDVDIPDQTWSAAGGTTNNTLVKALICFDPDTTTGTDSNIIPISHHDFAVTTDGSDLTMRVAASGFLRAQ